MAAAAPSWPC
uniref:Uncharacterized protein n=1 Tax=Arundo donax TaxID=35708 RepID=A0A0A8Z1C1_ARUDO